MGISVAQRPGTIQGPADHARVLHPAGPGLVTVARRTKGRWIETRYPVAAVPDIVEELARTPDVFLTQNRFKGPRRITYLTALDALWVDLDFHMVPEHAAKAPAAVLELVWWILEDARIPAPNFALSTGRGLAAVWLHEPVPRAALPRWRACQRRLQSVLQPLGADRAAIDPARVLRVVGTTNSKAQRLVTAITPVKAAWDFDPLADEILPLTRAEVTDLRTQRARRRAQKPRDEKIRPPQGFNAATLWEARLTDLQRLLDLRWWGTLPPGQRDTWLFVASVAMSWLAEPFLLRREVMSLAKQVGGWDEPEAATRLQAVFKRARMAAQGHLVEWNGQKVDPRYRFKTETILEWLQITSEEQAQLATLVSADVVRERDRQRHRKSMDRETYLAQAADRRAEAIRLRAKGHSLREIASTLGVSVGAVQYMLRDTKPSGGV